MKKFLTLSLAAAALFSAQAALLENSSFEELPEKKSDRTWRHYPAKGWQIYLANSDSSFEIVENGAFDGKRAVKMISKSNKGMATVRNEKRIPAAAGDQVYASAMIRGKGKCHIRICWYDKDGKMLKKYFISGKYAGKDWQKFEVTEKVPSGAESFVISCEAINVPAEVEFDAVDCNIVKAETIAKAEAEFPANGSFEVPSDKISNRNWRHFPAKGWEGYAHPDVKSYCKVITGDVSDGSRAVRLSCGDKKAIASLRSEVKPAVKPGDRIYVDAMIRGKGKGYIRIFWYDRNGKKLKNYYMDSRNATAQWKKFDTNVEVPAGVASFELSLEVIASIAEVDFDAVKCRISSGTVLDNGKIKAVINPRIGGGIDSLQVNGKKMEFSRANRIGDNGGMFTFIVPGERTPGILRFAQSKATVLIPNKKIEVVQTIDSGKLAGLEAVRTYELPDNSNEIKVTIEFRNKSKNSMEVSCRMQSFVSSANGSFTWPTPDWIQVFHQDGKPLNGLNSIVNDLLRTGWMARFYKDAESTLLFTYDIKKSVRAYNYIVPEFATVEWYYRPFTLKPGEVWKSDAAVKVLTGQKGIYLDEVALANKVRVEEIKPIEMPPPPAGEPLPPICEEFFPCGASLCNLFEPETAGMENRTGFYKMFRPTAMRLTRFLTDCYATSIGGVHLVMDGSHQEFFKTPDGKHEFGEFIREHRMAFGLGRMMYHRKDTDVEAYKKRLPEILKVWEAPNLQKFVHAYGDRLLSINTGDEPLPANIDVVLAANNALRKIMPKGAVIFTILNSSTVELMPYMPIYYADFYPIKRKSSSGANPWSVYPEFADKVKRAGEKPVWFMPQVFNAGEPRKYDIYAYPTDGEIRLMFNLAIAAGVRGIHWYGFTNTGWQWVKKYFHLRQSPLNASAMPGPGWEAIVDGFREMAGTGMLLLKSRPAALPAGCSVECGDFTDPNGFYSGAAVKLYALKSPKGMIIVAINQNPNAPEKAEITLPQSGWDFTALKPLEGKKITRKLAPGGAVYLYMGNDDAEIDAVHKGRYNREAARYLIAAKRAAGNGIAVIDPWKFDKLPGRQALAELNKEFAALNFRIDAAPLGKAWKLITGMRNYMGNKDFELVQNVEFIITPEMYEKTKLWDRYVDDPDTEFQQLKEKVIDDFRDVNRMTDYLDKGGNAEKVLPEIEALDKRVRANMEALMNAVVKRRNGVPPVSLRD